MRDEGPRGEAEEGGKGEGAAGASPPVPPLGEDDAREGCPLKYHTLKNFVYECNLVQEVNK